MPASEEPSTCSGAPFFIFPLVSPAIVFATSAQGTSLSTVAELSVNESKAKEINKQAQWKLPTIVRYLCLLIIDLAGAGIGDNDQGVIRLKEPCQRALRVKK